MVCMRCHQQLSDVPNGLRICALLQIINDTLPALVKLRESGKVCGSLPSALQACLSTTSESHRSASVLIQRQADNMSRLCAGQVCRILRPTSRRLHIHLGQVRPVPVAQSHLKFTQVGNMALDKFTMRLQPGCGVLQDLACAAPLNNQHNVVRYHRVIRCLVQGAKGDCGCGALVLPQHAERQVLDRPAALLCREERGSHQRLSHLHGPLHQAGECCGLRSIISMVGMTAVVWGTVRCDRLPGRCMLTGHHELQLCCCCT